MSIKIKKDHIAMTKEKIMITNGYDLFKIS